jgi:uncharacterized protein YbjT (DUF2867 family)
MPLVVHADHLEFLYIRTMFLLTGASGKTGKAIIRTLSNVESVCAFVHHAEHVSVSRLLGAEKVIVGDLRDQSAIRSAVEGARAVYHICPNMIPDEVVIGKLVIEEVKRAGMEHIVYHSVLHPQIEVMNHHWQKMRVEEMLFESGLPFTILQPAPYMQNLLAGWRSIVEDGVLRIPYSVDVKFSFLDLEDLAEVVRIVLTEAGHRNAIYELAGTNPTSHAEVAGIVGRGLNRNVRVEKEEIGDWRLRASGMSDYALENLIRMFEYYDKWGLVGNPNVLKWILKREPTSLASFVDRIVKERDEHN